MALKKTARVVSRAYIRLVGGERPSATLKLIGLTRVARRPPPRT